MKWDEMTSKDKIRIILQQLFGCFTFESEKTFEECMKNARKDYHTLPEGFHWPIAFWDEVVECWFERDQWRDPQPFDPLRNLNDTWRVVERITQAPTQSTGIGAPNVIFGRWWTHSDLWSMKSSEAAESICHNAYIAWNSRSVKVIKS